MRAARMYGFGEHCRLQVDELPDPPVPSGRQLLVRVAAASVNGTDVQLRRGRLIRGPWRRGPVIPGFDLAGTVVACGPAVTAYEPGDRVMALLGHAGGGHAELVLIDQGRAARVPACVDDRQAAGLPLAGLTALQALRGLAALPARTAPRVLISGAAGGIGCFAVQLAADAGAAVTAVASPARAAFVQRLGAAHVIDRTELTAVLAGRHGRFDVVLDAPGVLGFATVRPALAAGGMLVATRPVSPDALRALTPRRRGAPRVTAVRTRGDGADLAYLGHLVATGRLGVPIEQVYPLAEVDQAHRRLAAGGVPGKLVVEMPS